MYGASLPMYGVPQSPQQQPYQYPPPLTQQQGPLAYDDYGSAKPVHSFAGRAFARLPRRRLSAAPMFLALFAPWVLFAFVYAMEVFSVHYFFPALTVAVVVVTLILVLCVVGYAVRQRLKKLGYLPYFDEEARIEPSWVHVMAMLLCIAWIWAVIMGDKVFDNYQSPYQVIKSFNDYNNIAPESAKGAQLMDAGTAVFVANTTIDATKAMGFKNGITYCVAPIIHGGQPPASYDFWAVGTNCCSATQAHWQCPGYNDQYANGGIRLMSDGDRAFYRLAVQEAEAQYNIKSVHPVFFTWTADPVSQVESIHWNVVKYFLIGIASHFVWQMFAVTCCTLFFSKVGV